MAEGQTHVQLLLLDELEQVFPVLVEEDLPA